MNWRKRIPAGVAAVVVVAALELAFFASTPPLTGQPFADPTADDATIQAKVDLGRRRGGGAVCLVGDSSCFMGLDPAQLTDAAGGPVVNLGTLSSLTLSGYAGMTADLLERPVPPRAVVVAVIPYAVELTEEQARSFDTVGRYAVAYGRESPAYPVRPADYLSHFARKHRVNTFRPEFGGSYAGYVAALEASAGFRPESRSGIAVGWVRGEFRPSPFAVESLRALVRACRARGVPVGLWWSPNPEAAVTPDYAAGAAAWAAGFRAEEPGLTLLSPGPPRWPAERFATETHPNAAGAEANAAALAEALPGLLRQ